MKMWNADSTSMAYFQNDYNAITFINFIYSQCSPAAVSYFGGVTTTCLAGKVIISKLSSSRVDVNLGSTHERL